MGGGDSTDAFCGSSSLSFFFFFFFFFLWFFFVDWQANMDGAVNGMKARIQELQVKLQNKKLKKRSAVEDELKHLVEQMGAAQHDIDENEGKTTGLLSQKKKLTNKINAKKSSLTKFRSGAL